MVPPTCIGKYRLERELGRGGMGVVWLARDEALDRAVAIKQITAQSLGAVERQRFQLEARALARIQTPHVVAVYEADLDADPPYLVLEFVAGRSLYQVLREQGALPPSRLADAAGQALLGLAAAHRAGVLHRDLKPANLLLADQGLIKIADFGLALLDESDDGRLTNADAVVGTARYLAPEVARGGDHSARSDLYALGMTLLELAAGRSPHAGMKGAALVQKVAYQPLPPVLSHAPQLKAAPALAAWLERMLAFAPQDRYASAAEALSALDARRPAGAADASTASQPAVPMGAELTALVTTPTSLVTATVRPVPSPVTAVTTLHPRRLHLTFASQLTLSLWLASSAAAALAGVLIAHHAVGVQLQSWRSELSAAAAAAALQVQASDLRAASAGDAAAQTVVSNGLRAYLGTRTNTHFIYALTRDPQTEHDGSLVFVVDASDELDLDGNGIIDPNERNADPGERYDTSRAPRMREAFVGATADDQPTFDQWGTTLSGYAPVRDGDGVAGIVGLDVSEEHLARLRHGVWWHVLALEAGILVAFLAAAWLLGRRLGAPLTALLHALRRAARGDRHARADHHGGDEFTELAEAFNLMQERLREHEQQREALARVVTRGIAGRATGEAPAVLLLADLARCPQSEQAVRGVLAAARNFAAIPEGVVGRGVLLAFASEHDADQPLERALRAALAVAQAAGPGVLIGVAANEARAGDLARAAATARVDILADTSSAATIERHFYADRLRLADGSEAFALKGAVGAG